MNAPKPRADAGGDADRGAPVRSESAARLDPRASEPVVGARARLPVVLLSLVSGFLSLGYQVMWFRIYADRLGSTGLTFLLVLVAFIGGLGLGSLASPWVFERLARARQLAHPLAAVGAIEVGIALTALLTLVADPSLVRLGGPFPYAVDERGIWEPVLGLRLASLLAAGLMFRKRPTPP